jgi:hypothetical protein
MIAIIKQGFRLIPFPAPDVPAISLHGTLSLDHPFLTLQYSLAGDLESVLLPPASPKPGRKDELWKATCFEFFLAVKDQPGYWEFNLSPSGDWNVYRMDAYRRIGFREETGISQLPFEFQKGSEEYSLAVSVDLTPILGADYDLQTAVTAIVRTRDNKETYWALVHPAPEPDFHARESFILLLAGQTLPSARFSLDD